VHTVDLRHVRSQPPKEQHALVLCARVLRVSEYVLRDTDGPEHYSMPHLRSLACNQLSMVGHLCEDTVSRIDSLRLPRLRHGF